MRELDGEERLLQEGYLILSREVSDEDANVGEIRSDVYELGVVALFIQLKRLANQEQ